MLKYLVGLTFIFSSCVSFAENPKPALISGLNLEPVPPYQWFNYCSNQWDGSTIQIARRIFKKINTPIRFSDPVERNKINFQENRKALINGKSDAILSAFPIPFTGVRYMTTPIVEVELKIFHPHVLGNLNRISQLKNLQGIYFEQFEESAISDKIIQWATKNRLQVLIVHNAHQLNIAIKTNPGHYLIDYKYSSTIKRTKYSAFPKTIHLNKFYFAMAENSILKNHFQDIEKELAYIKESGLRTLLEQSSLRRWLNERKTIEICKNNYINKQSDKL